MMLRDFGLLTDENIDPLTVQFLRELGFDVLDVNEQGWAGHKDSDLLYIAHQQGRVVITHDSDFGTLVFTQGQPFTGILYLRPGHFDAEPHRQSIEAVLASQLIVSAPFILIAEHTRTKIKIRLRLR
jgi:predicted nuclease of predicted toxin-antitoxin system